MSVAIEDHLWPGTIKSPIPRKAPIPRKVFGHFEEDWISTMSI